MSLSLNQNILKMVSNKKTYLVAFFAVLLMGRAMACDVCGGNLGGIYYGILPQYGNSFIGVRYSMAHYNATMKYNSVFFEDERSNDSYHRTDILGRYAFNKKLNLNLILPYMVNIMDGTQQSLKSRGIGDPTLLVNYTMFNTGDDTMVKWKQSLQIGGGIKLPLGDFDRKHEGDIINRNFQMGTGSLDFLISGNYTIRYGSFGLSSENTYKYNTANRDDYHFGNQFTSSSNLFYWKETPLMAFLPFAGILYEQAGMHQLGKIDQLNTGGKSVLASFGAQIYHKSLSMTCQFLTPIIQKYNTDNIASINAGNRWSVGLIYSFKKKMAED